MVYIVTTGIYGVKYSWRSEAIRNKRVKSGAVYFNIMYFFAKNCTTQIHKVVATVSRHVIYQTLTDFAPWILTDLYNSYEKSIVNQNVKKKQFWRNPKVYYHLNNSPVLIQINSSHTLSPRPFKTNSINAFHLRLILWMVSPRKVFKKKIIV